MNRKRKKQSRSLEAQSKSSVFPRLTQRRRVSSWGLKTRSRRRSVLGNTEKPARPLGHIHSLTPTHSPALRLFRCKIPTIRLRHLLAQNNTHGAFSGVLPGGQRHNCPPHGVKKVRTTPVTQAWTENSRLFPSLVAMTSPNWMFVTGPPAALSVFGHWAAPRSHGHRYTGSYGHWEADHWVLMGSVGE